jgi:hypothetical protein
MDWGSGVASIQLNQYPVFTHLHIFLKQPPGSAPEQTEIDNLIFGLIFIPVPLKMTTAYELTFLC